ncbi:MAG: uroporphyrinogen decarboxylase family protein [Clostridia bacterium]
MNDRECFNKIMNFEPGVKTLKWEMGYWTETLARWYKEGLPTVSDMSAEKILSLNATNCAGEALPSPNIYSNIADKDVHTHFNLDKGIRRIPVDHWIFPWFERTILEETDSTILLIDEEGITKRISKYSSSIPQYVSWPISNREDFEKLKERFNPDTPGRFPEDWTSIAEELRNRDYPLALGAKPVGLFGSLRELMGYENLLTGYYDDPELIKDILSFLTEFWITLWDKILPQTDADLAFFWEDMSYNKGSLISPATFREFMTPYYKKLINYLKSHGINTIFVDTDGECTELIPLFMECGITGLLPFEVQAGMNIAKIAKDFPTLQIMGGLDKILISRGDKEEIDKELNEKVLPLLKRGGYIPCMDHIVNPEVSWETFIYYRTKLNQMIEGLEKK